MQEKKKKIVQPKKKQSTPKVSKKPVKTNDDNHNMDSETYSKFIKSYYNVVTTKQKLTRDTNILNDMVIHLDKLKQYPTSLTDHAFHQIITRLEEMTQQHKVVYDYVMKGNVNESMFIPSNLQDFVFNNVLRAIKNNTVKTKKSRSGGVETIFNTHMTEWNINPKEITFSCIVENGVVKTGYFNVHDK